MKAIVIGTSLSGKSTLIRHLRATTTLPISEMDEELTLANEGTFPSVATKSHLATQVITDILNRDSILFFANTDYFSHPDLYLAKSKGFKILQLSLSLDQLIARNAQRMKVENYEDHSQWFPGMVAYQQEVSASGLVDHVLDASLPTANIASQLLKSL